MRPLLKILAGALMMVLGVFSSIKFDTQLIALIQGGIGPLLVLIGAFIVWLESDELKLRSQEKTETADQGFKTQQTLENQKAESRAADLKQAVSKETSTIDTEEILSGTVREVKEEVADRDEIDVDGVEQLLEAEKQGKNRKTLVNYLERRLD